MSFVPLLSGITAGAAGESYATGDIIEFGYYPQSEVKDEGTLKQLNAALKESDWKSYGYRTGDQETCSRLILFEEPVSEAGDYMKYADVEMNNVKYRAVTFSQYRPKWDFAQSNEDNSNQDDNGYFINKVYWFRFDPLEWIVLDPDTGLVVTKDAIDNQPLMSVDSFTNSDDCVLSDWSKSTLRELLNKDFLDSVFTAEQQKLIKTKENSNHSKYSITGEGNEYPDAVTTKDKCFLLSYEDIYNSKYEITKYDAACVPQATDYAVCQGVSLGTNLIDSFKYAKWMLRTPANGKTTVVFECDRFGAAEEDSFSMLYLNSCASFGVRPAISIKDIAEADSEYTLTYDANGGNGAPEKQSGAREYVINEKSPVSGGKHFNGWSTRENAVTPEYKPGEAITLSRNTTLYAVWSKGQYTATFNADGGIFPSGGASESIKCFSGDYFTVPSCPSREGYRFGGWESIPAFMPQSDAVYKAVWLKITDKTFERYSFPNNRSVFKTDFSGGAYFLETDDTLKLFNYVRAYSPDADNIISALNKYMGQNWNGSCFGMAATSVLNFQNRIDFVKNYGGQENAKALGEILLPTSKNGNPRDETSERNVISAINYYMISQFIDFIRSGSTGVIGDSDITAWINGMNLLISTAQKGEPFLFNYRYEHEEIKFGKWVTSLKGHAIVALDCSRGDDGSYRIKAYDNVFPEGDAFIVISQDLKSCRFERPDGTEQIIREIEFYTDMSAFDKIDIDGVNNDMKISFADFRSSLNTTQIILPGDSDITVTSESGKTLNISGGEISGDMDIASSHIIACSDENGDDTGGFLIVNVKNDKEFDFESESGAIDAAILNEDVFASAEAENADIIKAGSGGIEVEGSGVDYSLTLASKEDKYTSVGVDGVAKDGVSLKYSGDQMILDGVDGKTETVTVFSDKKADTNAYGIEEGYDSVKIQSNGCEGEVDILGEDKGVYETAVKKIKETPKIEIENYTRNVYVDNPDKTVNLKAKVENMPENGKIQWYSKGQIQQTGEIASLTVKTSAAIAYWDHNGVLIIAPVRAAVVSGGKPVAVSKTVLIRLNVESTVKITDVKQSGSSVALSAEVGEMLEGWHIGWLVNDKLTEATGESFTVGIGEKYTEIKAAVVTQDGFAGTKSEAKAFRGGAFKMIPSEDEIAVKPKYTKTVGLTFENPENKNVRLEVDNYDKLTYHELEDYDYINSCIKTRTDVTKYTNKSGEFTVTGLSKYSGNMTVTAYDKDTGEILDRVIMSVTVSDEAPGGEQKISLKNCAKDEYFYDNMEFVLKSVPENLPERYALKWKVNGKYIDKSGDTLYLDETKEDFTVQVEAYFNDELLAKSEVTTFHYKKSSTGPKIKVLEGTDVDIPKGGGIILHLSAENVPENSEVHWDIRGTEWPCNDIKDGKDYRYGIFYMLDDKYQVFDWVNVHIIPEPEIAIRGYKEKIDVDYRSTVIFNAETKNLPEGAKIHWVVYDKTGEYKDNADSGTRFSISDLREDRWVVAAIEDRNGIGYLSDAVQIHIKDTGFFAKIIAFFRGLFGVLPVYEDCVKK